MADRGYTWNSDGQYVLVTEPGKVPFTLTEQDARYMERTFRVEREQVGMPRIERDEYGVKLIRGKTTLVIERADWDQFKREVEDIEFPKLIVPEQVQVDLAIQASHTVEMEASDLLDGDHRFDSDDMTWAGTQEEMDDALVDVVTGWDWYSQLEDIISGFDYIDQIDTDTRW